MMMMRHHHKHHYNPEVAEKEAHRQRTERDLEGTELSPLEATLAGLGCGALLASGTAGKLLRRTIMARLPESAGLACLAGAVAGALTSTGLWQARRTERNWGMYRQMVLPLWWL
jgi:hypothetical protein